MWLVALVAIFCSFRTLTQLAFRERIVRDDVVWLRENFDAMPSDERTARRFWRLKTATHLVIALSAWSVLLEFLLSPGAQS